MDDIVDAGALTEAYQTVRDWFLNHVLVLETLAQLPLIAVLLAAGYFAARLLRARIAAHVETREPGTAAAWTLRVVLPLAFPLIGMILLWLDVGISRELGWAQPVTRIVASLFTAWVVIRLITNALGSTSWTRFLSVVIWIIAALAIVELLTPTLDFLDSVAVTLGDLRISALTVIKALIVLAIALWLAALIGRLVDRRLDRSQDLTPAIRVLTGKLVRIALIAIAIVIGLTSVGIDVSGLAVVGGALGLGIGLGLQRIVANLVSGVILLMDKSIKPGDVLEVGETYGWIKSLHARYVSIQTRDGTEHLIPNEMLITDRVINWSYTNNLVRLKLDIGVSYQSDVHKAIELCIEGASGTPRVLDTPKPVCFITGFGESSVDLSLRLWINDPDNGVSNVRGAVYLAVWDLFHEHGIEIPFPQRDLHIRSGLPAEWFDARATVPRGEG